MQYKITIPVGGPGVHVKESGKRLAAFRFVLDRKALSRYSPCHQMARSSLDSVLTEKFTDRQTGAGHASHSKGRVKNEES